MTIEQVVAVVRGFYSVPTTDRQSHIRIKRGDQRITIGRVHDVYHLDCGSVAGAQRLLRERCLDVFLERIWRDKAVASWTSTSIQTVCAFLRQPMLCISMTL